MTRIARAALAIASAALGFVVVGWVLESPPANDRGVGVDPKSVGPSTPADRLAVLPPSPRNTGSRESMPEPLQPAVETVADTVPRLLRSGVPESWEPEAILRARHSLYAGLGLDSEYRTLTDPVVVSLPDPGPAGGRLRARRDPRTLAAWYAVRNERAPANFDDMDLEVLCISEGNRFDVVPGRGAVAYRRAVPNQVDDLLREFGRTRARRDGTAGPRAVSAEQVDRLTAAVTQYQRAVIENDARVWKAVIAAVAKGTAVEVDPARVVAVISRRGDPGPFVIERGVDPELDGWVDRRAGSAARLRDALRDAVR